MIDKNNIFIIYLIIINIISFAAFGIDKLRAIKKKWRISESALLIISLLGGVMGGLLGMFFFHHKTRKTKFTVLMPLILILHICIIMIVKVNI